jgi:hypothetical protein
MPKKNVCESVLKVSQDQSESLNIHVMRLADSNNWIDCEDLVFYLMTARKSRLAQRQLARRQSINIRLLRRFLREYPEIRDYQRN